MKSTLISMEHLALKKAKELDIPPKLLLIALSCLAENGQATDEQILERYRKLVLNDQKQEAIALMQSSHKKDREYGIYALSEALTGLLEIVRDQSYPENSIDTYAERGETLKNYHLEAWHRVNEELVKVKSKFRKLAGMTELTGIINYFCSDEINRLQQAPARAALLLVLQ